MLSSASAWNLEESKICRLVEIRNLFDALYQACHYIITDPSKLCLGNTNVPENVRFLKSVPLVFDLDLGK